MQKLIVGLTGGMGSGKSTVAEFFAELGITIIDTDQIARDVVYPGSPALQKIIQHFGQQVLNTEGTLNRTALRHIIFTAPNERQWLEKLLHPLIHAEAKRQAKNSHSAYCIIVIPLLVENLPNRLVHRILVVDIKKSTQIARIKRRDQLTDTQIRPILEAQANRKQRLQAADDVIDNNKDIEHLKPQVKKLHQYYLTFN